MFSSTWSPQINANIRIFILWKEGLLLNMLTIVGYSNI